MNTINEVTISKALKNLGVSPALLGYAYLREAIQLAVDDITIVYAITKSLYPTIAKRFDSTPARVERAIRHAIEISWLNADHDFMVDVFGYTVSVSRGKPTNSTFIATIADYLLMNLKGE